MMKRLCFFSFVVVLSIYCITAHAVQSQESTLEASSTFEATYEQALLDAKNDAEIFTKDINWFFAGFCCSVFGPLYAVLDTPTVPSTRLLGKSAEYIEIYTNEFQATAKMKRIRLSILGCGTISVVNFVGCLGT